MNAEKVLAIAKAEIGVKESPPDSNNVKYNTWYYGKAVRGDDYPWCMAFVQWCFYQAKWTLPYKTPSCSGLLNWYRQHNPACVVKTPKPGDIAIYNFGHTGIVESVASRTVTVIEGNTSPSNSGSQDNGGMVCRRTRSTSLVTAYIRPVEKTGDEDEDMTTEQFKKLWNEVRKELQDNDAGAYSAEARAWAIQNGIIQGNITEAGGEPNYMWEDFLTRQQMVTLLYRFAKLMGKV